MNMIVNRKGITSFVTCNLYGIKEISGRVFEISCNTQAIYKTMLVFCRFFKYLDNVQFLVKLMYSFG